MDPIKLNSKQIAVINNRIEKQELSKKFKQLVQEKSDALEVIARNEKRRAWWGSQISLATISILTAWMRLIPGSGFLLIAAKVAKNPGSGGYEVFRSNYGNGAWNLWGDGANSVSSPLTYNGEVTNGGIGGYNLATGNPTMFNENSRVNAEFAEMTTANTLFKNIPGYETVISSGTSLTWEKDKAKAILGFMEGKSLTIMRLLLQEYNTEQGQALLSLKLMAGMTKYVLTSRDGYDDIIKGRLDVGGKLCTGSDIDNLVPLHTIGNINTDLPLTKMSDGSRMRSTLLQTKPCESYYTMDWINKGEQVRDVDFLPKNLANEVLKTKAIYMTYWNELTSGSLFHHYLNKYLLSVLKSANLNETPAFNIMINKANKRSGLHSAFGRRMTVALACIHDLTANYHGHNDISALPTSDDYDAYLQFSVYDCALCAASIMTRDTNKFKAWFFFFVEYQKLLPEYRAYKTVRSNRTNKKDYTINEVWVPGFAEFRNVRIRFITEQIEIIHRHKLKICPKWSDDIKTISLSNQSQTQERDQKTINIGLEDVVESILQKTDWFDAKVQQTENTKFARNLSRSQTLTIQNDSQPSSDQENKIQSSQSTSQNALNNVNNVNNVNNANHIGGYNVIENLINFD